MIPFLVSFHFYVYINYSIIGNLQPIRLETRETNLPCLFGRNVGSLRCFAGGAPAGGAFDFFPFDRLSRQAVDLLGTLDANDHLHIMHMVDGIGIERLAGHHSLRHGCLVAGDEGERSI